jgi:DedD protein
MGLLSFLKRKPAAAAPAPSRRTQEAAAPTPDQARVRARQRLIGAAVLVLIGVVGFPILFDTTPRPIPVDIPIEIPKRDAVAPLQPAATTVPPAAAVQRLPVADDKASAAQPRPEAQSPAHPAPAPATATVAVPAPKPVDAPRAQVDPSAAEKAQKAAAQKLVADKAAAEKAAERRAAQQKAEADRARALLENQGTTPKASEAAGRFVVQVGAFSEVSSAREARQKLEKLGLRTYTQVVDTGSGKRIRVRVGPYGDRAEAEKAASQIKQAGLPSAVLTL